MACTPDGERANSNRFGRANFRAIRARDPVKWASISERVGGESRAVGEVDVRGGTEAVPDCAAGGLEAPGRATIWSPGPSPALQADERRPRPKSAKAPGRRELFARPPVQQDRASHSDPRTAADNATTEQLRTVRRPRSFRTTVASFEAATTTVSAATPEATRRSSAACEAVSRTWMPFQVRLPVRARPASVAAEKPPGPSASVLAEEPLPRPEDVRRPAVSGAKATGRAIFGRTGSLEGDRRSR